MQEFTAHITNRSEHFRLAKLLYSLDSTIDSDEEFVRKVKDLIDIFNLEDVTVKATSAKRFGNSVFKIFIRGIELEISDLTNLGSLVNAKDHHQEIRMQTDSEDDEDIALVVSFEKASGNPGFKTIFTQNRRTVTDHELEELRKTAESYMKTMHLKELSFTMVDADTAEMNLEQVSPWFGA